MCVGVKHDELHVNNIIYCLFADMLRHYAVGITFSKSCVLIRCRAYRKLRLGLKYINTKMVVNGM